MQKRDLDYLNILKALKEIPFRVGRTLLIEFLQGDETNESVIKNNLSEKASFASMAYDSGELHHLIDQLIKKELINVIFINGSWKVLELSALGREELRNPVVDNKATLLREEISSVISEADKKLFDSFNFFLNSYNDMQKKAIITNKKHVLCIAGAGSGKTSVLVKRIEFLTNYRSINPGKILAITFTRKSRQEMANRLESLGISGISVETFNSFCEKILIKYNDLVYQNKVRVITYKDKLSILHNALTNLNIDMNRAIDVYFTLAQRKSKSPEELATIFLNDCFFIRDYFKFKNNEIVFKNDKHYDSGAKLVFSLSHSIEAHMKKYGLRDFSDQLVDSIKLFEEHNVLIPEFDHILIDEYQDVNSLQIKLIDLLPSKNIFCVGDPRQSIYGWRGSDIKYITDFKEKYPDCERIFLTINYRSSKFIVHLINDSIKNMGLPDLISETEGTKDIKLVKFDCEANEFEFVVQRILSTDVARNEIFVLARTNRQLNELSNLMKMREIKHLVRSDEIRKTIVSTGDEVTLATVHAIKGLEAKMVFVIGCTSLNFPCKTSEHPIMELITDEHYDKDAEEKRLFYVAMSRAKLSLYLTYSTQKHTSFITPSMLTLLDHLNSDRKTQYKQTSLL